MLKACGVDLQKLRHDLVEFLDRDLKELKKDAGVDPKPAPGFQRVVQRAAIHVQSSGRDEVTGANVLVALFSERESHAVYFLQLHDMTRLDAVNFIAHGIAKKGVALEPNVATADAAADTAKPADTRQDSPGGSRRRFRNDVQASTDDISLTPRRGFERIAEVLINIIEDVVNQVATSGNRGGATGSQADALLTMGLFGPWGSGKSTLANLIASKLRKRNYICITLNPWKWGTADDLYDLILTEVHTQLRSTGLRLHAQFSAIMRYLRMRGAQWLWIVAITAIVYIGFIRLDWQSLGASTKALATNSLLIAITAGLVKVGCDLLGKQIERKVFQIGRIAATGPTLSSAYRHIAWFERARRKSGKRPIVFFVEDLDRCSPDRVADVLESVHSFTAAGCITFLMCDRDYVEATLYSKYEKIASWHPDGRNFGRRYLDKIVQIPFHVPAIGDLDLLEIGLLARPRTQLSSRAEAGGKASTLDWSRFSIGVGLGGDEPQMVPREEPDPELSLLTEIAGDILLEFVQDIGLNIRQIKSIRNTLKVYLDISRPVTESLARSVAVFVLMNMLDRDWLDDFFYEIQPGRRRFTELEAFYERAAISLGLNRQELRAMFRLVGRHPACRVPRNDQPSSKVFTEGTLQGSS